MPITVAIDISPTTTGHATRGIGVYTRNLIYVLEQESKRAREQELKIEAIDFKTQNSKLKTQNFDLIHYPYFDLFYLTLPLRKPVKTIVTIHDVIPLIFPDHYPPGIKGKIKFIIQKLSLRSVSAVITDSQNSKRDIIRYLGYPKEKIYVIPLAQSGVFRIIKPTLLLHRIKVKYRLPKKFVLYVGDINYNKNIPGLVKACEKIGIPLVIAGKQAIQGDIDRTHPENQDLVWLQDYHFQLSVSNLQPTTYNLPLILTGFVPDEDLVAIYNLATVYCQPSFYEGFGLPVLEAMASGCPVVASNVASLPEICGEAALMVDPKDYNNIAEGLKKIITDRHLKEKLVTEGLRQSKKFSWEKVAKETLRVYEKVT